MTWPPPLYLEHAGQHVSVDVTRMGIPESTLLSMPWRDVFAARDALEGGSIANPDEQRQVGHYWLRAPGLAPTVAMAGAIGDQVDAVRELAQGVRSGTITASDGEPFTDVLHIGIGGSALGPALLVDAIPGPEGLGVHFLDNIDPHGIRRVLDDLGDRLDHTLIVVVSKSGSTPEPMGALSLVAAAASKKGIAWAKNAVAITVQGSKLDRQARSEGWLSTLYIWDWVGGRTSATSAVGLLPLDLAGGDVSGFLSGAASMDAWTRANDPLLNPAALLAGTWFATGNGVGERANVILPYADALVLLSRYLQQLVMESIGKSHDLDGNEVHQGLTIYGNKGSTDQHAYIQQLRDGRNDFFATFVQVLDRGDVAVEHQAGDTLQAFLMGTRSALAEAGRPCATLTVDTVDAQTLGALVALFERAVSFYATLVNLNAYHQPGVEAGKKAARRVLDQLDALRSELEERPRNLRDLSTAIGADATSTHELLRRLAITGRAKQHGHGLSSTWSRP